VGDAARALFVRRGGLGDTLLMVPVLRALRRARPGCELHVAGVHEFVVLLAHFGVADAAWSSEDVRAWPAARRNDYAAVVVDDPALAALFASSAVRAFDPRPRGVAPLAQQVAAQLALALHWPHDAWLRDASLHDPPGAANAPVMLAPGSGSRSKCWPRERWLELARELGGAQVLVGPVEVERDDPRAWPWPVRVQFVAGDTIAMAARLQAAGAFVGNDSGTTHLAAMLGLPTVALFGAGDPAVFAPIGPRATVLQAASRRLEDLAVPAVAQALAALRQN
jgi:ADP-heptose:LPS heptosyltransferase